MSEAPRTTPSTTGGAVSRYAITNLLEVDNAIGGEMPAVDGPSRRAADYFIYLR
jgi:hypothetical protein